VEVPQNHAPNGKAAEGTIGPLMFSEDVVLGGLKAGPSWFISDHLLLMHSRNGNAEDVARQIADRDDLRRERSAVDGKSGFRFWRIE